MFSHNDCEHPAIKEIFRLSVLFRNEYKSFNSDSNLQSDQDIAAENSDKEKIIKLNMADITLPEMPSIVVELNDVIIVNRNLNLPTESFNSIMGQNIQILSLTIYFLDNIHLPEI